MCVGGCRCGGGGTLPTSDIWGSRGRPRSPRSNVAGGGPAPDSSLSSV